MAMDWSGIGSSAISAGIGAGLDAVGGYFSARQQAAMQKQMYKHRYQWEVQDLKKAGLNPMLAVTNGGPGAAPSVAPADYGGIGTKAVGTYLASRANSAQVANLEENTNFARAKGNEALANAEQTDLANTITKASPEYRNATDALLPGGSGTSALAQSKVDLGLQQAGAAVKKLIADGELSQQQLEQNAQLNPIKIEIEKLRRDTDYANLSEAQANGAMWRDLGPGGKLFDKYGPIVATAMKFLLKYVAAKD